MNGPWIKLYRSFISDGTVQYLIARHGHVTVTVLVTLMCVTVNGVVTKPIDELATLCRIDEEVFAELVAVISDRGIISRDSEGKITFNNWNKYQQSSSTERTRKYREKIVTQASRKRHSDGHSDGHSDANVTGEVEERSKKLEEENIKNSPHTNSSDMCVENQIENPTGVQGQGLTRIEKARLAWNESKAGPPMRLNVLNMGPDNRHSCMLPLPAYSDEEIAEAIDTYAKVRASPDHEVRAPYQSFVGFMRSGIEKFIAAADPWAAYKRQRGNSYRDIEDRDREAALAMLGGGK